MITIVEHGDHFGWEGLHFFKLL